MKSQRIFECDVDGVIFDIWSPVEKILAERGVDFSFDRDVKTYQMYELGNLRDEVLRLLLDADVRHRASFFAGADAFVRYLSYYCRSNDFALVFNTHEHNREAAIEKQNRLISFFKESGLTERDYMYQISMADNKEMLKSVIVIDDCVANLERSDAVCRIIFDRFHNRGETDMKYERTGSMFRVKSYRDCQQFLDDLITSRLNRKDDDK